MDNFRKSSHTHTYIYICMYIYIYIYNVTLSHFRSKKTESIHLAYSTLNTVWECINEKWRVYIKSIHLHFSLVHSLKVLFTVKHAVVCGKKVLFTVKHVVECRRKVSFTVKQWSTKNPCQDCKATQFKQRKIEQHRSMHALSSLRND